MSGEGSSVDAAAPNLNLTPEEKRAYGQLFRQADEGSVGIVTGEVAVKFFEKTGLDSHILGEIWQIADRENRGFLTPAGFGITLRLIGHAQHGRKPSPDIALQQGPIPRFEGLSLPTPVASPPPVAALQAQGSGGPVRIPPLTPERVAHYGTLFDRQPLQNNTLPGDQARTIFEKSGLPNEVLGKIWQLADTEQRGALVQTEFVIAMHLLTSMKTGTLRVLPNILPAPLYEAATRRGPPVAGRMPPNTTGMSAIPRQLSGTAQHRTGSPLGRPPADLHNLGGSSDWAVTPADKAKFDLIFADLDKGNKGYITGEEAVPFFGQSNLGEDALAQIWDLSDINSRGQLSREEFAVAMYLIRQQRGNRSGPLPTTLPTNLIPPNLRTLPRPPPVNSAFDPPPPPPPQPKSALDDLFGLDSSSSSPAPGVAPQPTGGSNSADPFAGGSSSITPSSPILPATTGNKFAASRFVPSSSFGRGLANQSTGDLAGSTQLSQTTANDDLLGDNDPEISKKLTGETTELANLSNQIGSLSEQMKEVQSKRTTTQNELNQTNSQKQNFEQRLSQLRTLYEKEARDAKSLQEQLRTARSDTQKLQGECMKLEGTYRDVQTQHQETLAALQADQQENAKLRERIRTVNAEIAQLKPQIEKLKSEARQQKGLVAINKKQLSTTENERDKLKTEAEDLAKGAEEATRQAQASTNSPASSTAQVASPALSTSSNPFFKRSASTDIMGAFASPPAMKSVDDVFGPAFTRTTNTPPPATSFGRQNTGNSTTSVGSGSAATPPASSSPTTSRQATLAAEPPAPPASRQISSSFLPFPDRTESLSSSRQVSPPASRAEVSSNDGSAFPVETPLSEKAGNVPGAFPDHDGDKSDTANITPTQSTAPVEGADKPSQGSFHKPTSSDPFANLDHEKAKEDFDSAFAAHTSAKQAQDKPEGKSAFDTEFPPISELERDDESDSDSERAGFEDDFAPSSPPAKSTTANKSATLDSAVKPDATSPTSPFAPANDDDNTKPSSPVTITNSNAHTSGPQTSSVDDIFGSAGTGTVPSISQPVPSNPPNKDFDDDDFEGLEDAKEGSADDDFANISRSGLDEFNPVFDSSPPASQTKSESTTFGNESSFDFVSTNSATGAPAPSGGNQQKAAETHDWDAIFSGLDSPTAAAATPPPAKNATGGGNELTVPETRPAGPGRALTEEGVHDDPILKDLIGMGYSRSDSVQALEKYDYNLERAANFLASQS